MPRNLKVQTDIIERDAVIDVLPFGTITKGRKGEGEVVDFESMADKVVGFSDDGTGVQTGELMEKAMAQCAKLNKIISAHCEVNDLLKGGYIHDGVYCKEHGHKGICSKSEWAQIERDCKLAEKRDADITCAIFQLRKALILSVRLRLVGLKLRVKQARII